LKSDVKLIVSRDFGLSHARNEGIRNSHSEIIAFIDDDAIADPNWLRHLVEDFGSPSVIGSGGRIKPIWPGQTPRWFPEELYWIVGCSYKGLPTKKAPIRNPIGCNMCFRRKVFEDAGYFSSDIGRIGNNLFGHEDTEFAIRATNKLHNTKILYEPDSLVYHRISWNRASLRYVMKRSFAEGLSKAFFSQKFKTRKLKSNESTLNVEEKYLLEILLSVPNKVFRRNILTNFAQLSTLLVSTFMVFLGYVAGLKR
jgi:glycosyltransferase involved in cell wall biosynthesis